MEQKTEEEEEEEGETKGSLMNISRMVQNKKEKKTGNKQDEEI